MPIAILGFILIGGGFTRDRRGDHNYRTDAVDLVDTYCSAWSSFDFVITALWFGSIRRLWRRQEQSGRGRGSVDNWAVRALRRLRRIGYTAPAGVARPVETV